MKKLTLEELEQIRNVYLQIKGGVHDYQNILDAYELIKVNEDEEFKSSYIRRWYHKNYQTMKDKLEGK